MKAKQRYYEKLIGESRCPRCTMRPPREGGTYCKECQEYVRQYAAHRREQRRIDADEKRKAKNARERERRANLKVVKKGGKKRARSK